MTVFRGGKPDRVPLCIYAWIYRWAQPGSPPGARPYTPLLTFIDTRGVYRETVRNVTLEHREVTEGGRQQTVTRLVTPIGELTQRTEPDPAFGSRWVREHFVKTVDDYRVMRYVCDHTALEPDFDELLQADTVMGDEGVVVAGLPPVPLVWLQAEAMGTETWCMAMMEHPDEFQELLASVSRLYRKRLEIAAGCPAEVIWYADSLTGALVPPHLFEAHCSHEYAYGCKMFRQAGKLTFAHFDGANAPIQENIARTDIDIIEAFTPPPMGQMTVAQARAAWPEKAVSLNFPGNLFTSPDDEIEAYTRQYLREGGREGKFVIGCTEEFPPNEFDRVFSAIARTMDAEA